MLRVLLLLQISPTTPIKPYVTAGWGRSCFLSCGDSCLQDSHWPSHGRPPAAASRGRPPRAQRRCRWTEARTLRLRGPHRPAHLAARRILSTHIPGTRRGREETVGEEEKSREVLRPSLPCGPLCSYPCPNLTFIGKSIHPGGPLSNLPENTTGEGTAVAWATGQRPQTFLGDKMGFHGSKGPGGHWCLLTSKANHKKATVNQLAPRE